MKLSKDGDSSASLGKKLGLKKGHLQFQVRCLLDADYIRYDRKSRLCSINDKGAIALDEVTKLICRSA